MIVFNVCVSFVFLYVCSRALCSMISDIVLIGVSHHVYDL